MFYRRGSKSWDNSFELLVETQNAYTGCRNDVTTIGKSRWSVIGVIILPEDQTLTLTPTATSTPTPVGPMVLWEADVVFDGFQKAVDRSVVCENFPPKLSDIEMYLVDDISTPYDINKATELVANAKNRPGVRINAIIHRKVPFIGDGVYKVCGYWRKPPGSSPENIDVNLSSMVGNQEFPAEIIWRLNPWAPNYGWVFTRIGSEDLYLYKLGDDNSWHYFSITVEYRGGKSILRELQIDSRSFDINREIQSITKPWTEEGRSISVLLETENMNTNCDPDNRYVGVSRWGGLRVVYSP
jgi:hypothetical protein